jgi:hypothetical protein
MSNRKPAFTDPRRPGAAVLALGVALALAGPAGAGQAEADAVLAHCRAELNVPPAVCPCLADKALALEEGQQALLAAIVSGNDATAAKLRTELPVAQVMEVGMFHVDNTPACAAG